LWAQKGKKLKIGAYFLGILFLINTVDSNSTIAKNGRIISDEGNSGIVGVGEVVGDPLVVGVVVGEDEVGLDVGLELGEGVGVGVGTGDGVGGGLAVASPIILTR
jgi:hypothetical protein